MKSEAIKKAFEELFPDRNFDFSVTLTFTGRVKDYGSRARMRGKELSFAVGKDWRDVDEDIFMGMIQELLCKLLKTKRFTKRMELYKIFVKKLALTVPKVVSDPILELSFERVNERYFNGVMEKPNLKFGKASIRTVGTYNFHNDTITISKVLEDDHELIDYVMYHELLHKKIQFDHKKRNYSHHTKAFREDEKKFDDAELMEKRLERLLRGKRFPFLG